MWRRIWVMAFLQPRIRRTCSSRSQRKDKVVYGQAFDIVKLTTPIDLGSLPEVEANLAKITVLEIKWLDGSSNPISEAFSSP